MNTQLTDKAIKYLELVKKSFMNEDDYNYYIQWIANKIQHSNVLNQGLVIYNSDFKIFDLIYELQKYYPELIYTFPSDSKYEKESKIIVIDNTLDDAKRRRIKYAYNLNEFHNYKGDVYKNNHDFVIYTKDLLRDYLLEEVKMKFKYIIKIKLIKKSESDDYKQPFDVDSLAIDETLVIDDEYFENYLNEEDVKSIYEYLLNYKCN